MGKEYLMSTMVKRVAAGAILGGSALFAGGLAIANAAPPETNDGLVKLSIGGGNTISGLKPDVAGQIAGLLCGPGGTTPNPTNASGVIGTNANVGDIVSLSSQVAAGTIPNTTCDSPQGVVTISQNGATNAPTGVTTGPNGVTNAPSGVTGSAENNGAVPGGPVSQSPGQGTAPMPTASAPIPNR
jgi:hypothetical protein